MTIRTIGAASLIALTAACSQQAPAPRATSGEAAHLAYLSGDLDRAEDGYLSILSDDPTDAAALLGMGEIAEAQGDRARAADYYRQAAERRSGDIRVWQPDVTYAEFQDGVTEVAHRRLGALGHGTMARPAPAQPAYTYVEPAHAAPAVITHPVESYTVIQGDPMIAPMPHEGGHHGGTYYADPAATQPIDFPVYQTPEAALPHGHAPSIAAHRYLAPAPAAPMRSQGYRIVGGVIEPIGN